MTASTTDLSKLGYLFAEIRSSHDVSRLDEIKAMTDPTQPTTVTHWLAPQLDRNAPTTPSSDASD